MYGLLVICFKLLLLFRAVSCSPAELENGQEKNNLIVVMLSKMEAMQTKINMLENSDREMKQTLADVTVKFQTEIDQLQREIESYKATMDRYNNQDGSDFDKEEDIENDTPGKPEQDDSHQLPSRTLKGFIY